MRAPERGNGQVIAVSYHDTVNVLQGVFAEGSAAAVGPFARAEWFAMLEASGVSPFVAIARDGDAAIALPFVRRGHTLEAMTNWYSFTWRPIMNGAPEPLPLLTAVARDLKQKFCRVILSPLPDEDDSAAQLENAFRLAGWKVTREVSDHNHVLPVNGRSFAEYWASRPGQMRTTLKRKAKKVTIEILTGFDPDAWAAYETIYGRSWKPEEGDPALLRQFAEAEGAAGRIRLGIAYFEELPVAAQLWTVEHGVAYIHKLAHLEEHKGLSAGTTLSAALFEHVLEQDKVALVDFGTGNDRYKRDWMEVDRPRYRLDCIDATRPRAWPVLARQAAARVARALRQS